MQTFIEFIQEKDPILHESMIKKLKSFAKNLGGVAKKMPLTMGALGVSAGLGGVHSAVKHGVISAGEDHPPIIHQQKSEKIKKSTEKPRGKVVGRIDNAGDV